MGMRGNAVVVTGAGSGIGRAVVERLVGLGASVTAVGRRAEPLHSIPGDHVLPLALDITGPGAADEVVAATIARFGRVDAVVNNAGLARFAPLEQADPADFAAMLAVNLVAPIALVRAALGALRERRGSVVNVTSVGGVLPMPNRSLYGATKAALNSITRSFALEFAPTVRVNAVLPGPVDTPMYDDLGLSPERSAVLRRELVAATPLARFGRPAEVADWVCRLIDDEVSGWITGVLLPVDGGRTT
jgi:NAD(P)-dependent dehydrogenase (short-subunit alcohol dehydrogenase family)